MKINENAPDKIEFYHSAQDGSKKIVLIDNEVLTEKPIKFDSIEKQIQWTLSVPFQPEKPVVPTYKQKLTSVYDHLDLDKNTPESLKIYTNVTKRAWWKHSVCGHSYLLSIPNRFIYEPECRLCHKLKDPSYSFLITHWNEEKNGKLNFFPEDATKVYLKCPDCLHEEFSTIRKFTNKTGCTECKKIKDKKLREQKKLEISDRKRFHGSSLKERELYYFFTLVFGGQVKNRCTINKKEVDVFVPEYNIAIEYDGFFFHKGREYVDKLKNDKLKEVNINVIRIRENGLNKISEDDIVVKYNDRSVRESVGILFDKLKTLYKLSKEHLLEIDRFLSQDINSIQLPNELLRPVLYEDSIEFHYPNLKKYFHPYFNTEYKLDQTSRGAADKLMWWKCPECKLEWREASKVLIKRTYVCHRCKINKEQSNN